MPIKYNIIGKTNPRDPQAPKKYYANAKADGVVTFRTLSRNIAARSTTVSDTDVLAVLNELTKELAHLLSDGKIVRFGDFGSFQIAISSEGMETEKQVTPASIKSAKITFRPGTDLKEMLNNATYEKLGQ